MVGPLVVWAINWYLRWLVGRLVRCFLVGWSLGQLVVWLVDRLLFGCGLIETMVSWFSFPVIVTTSFNATRNCPLLN